MNFNRQQATKNCRLSGVLVRNRQNFVAKKSVLAPDFWFCYERVSKNGPARASAAQGRRSPGPRGGFISTNKSL